MKRALVHILALFAALSVIGQNKVDSAKVYFSVNQSRLDRALDNNAVTLDSLVTIIRRAADDNTLNRISIRAYASPEGQFFRNLRLARQRGSNMADYLIGQTGVSPDSVQTLSGGIAWTDLRRLVAERSDVPSRERVLEILDSLINNTPEDSQLPIMTGGGIEYQLIANRQLAELGGGKSYRWMIDNLFPRLRYALVKIDMRNPAAGQGAQTADSLHQIASDGVTDATGLNGLLTSDDYMPRHRLALKTNLLYYAALMPNIEVEWLINDHWSAAVNWDVAWWGSYSRDKSYRMSIISAEGRRWINPRAPWHGLFAGLFAGYGWYDLLKNVPGYHGEGVMTGLSVGYMWPATRNLSFEASVGAGYLYTRYKEYEPFEGHHIYLRTKSLNYFGPLKLKFSLVWRFWDTNRPRPAADRL